MKNTLNIKEYFDISSYRNTLDMINTFDGVLNRWGNDLHNQGVYFYFAAIYDQAPDNTPYYNGVRVAISRNTGIVGYAISRIGNKGVYATPGELIKRTMQTNGLNNPALPSPRQLSANSLVLKKEITQRTYKNVGFSIRDLLLLSRNLNWELNRLRLPVPANFRQINSTIQGKDYSMIRDFNTNNRGINISASKAFITLIELMGVYSQLKKAVNVLRVSVRKEIDAANLSKKVREETLRQEQAALITRQQAQQEAEQKRIEILAEKKASYEKEILDAQRLQDELKATKIALRAELDQLKKFRRVATEPELLEIGKKEKSIGVTVDKIDNIIVDKNNALSTAKDAATNLNIEIIDVVAEAKQLQNKNLLDKKSNLTPILLTIVAGVLLT